MADPNLLHRLCALAEHRRWLLGVTASARYGSISAALVATLGSGLESGVEVVAHRSALLPRNLRTSFQRLRHGLSRDAAPAVVLAAQLAERQALLLEELASEVAPVWNRISAVAVHGPGVRHRAQGLIAYVGLCDAARLADMTGLNVIDGFPDRDLAQDGRGSPLHLLPMWMLLHDARKLRVVVDWGRRVGLIGLPASRDAVAAARTSFERIDLAANTDESASATVARCIRRQFPAVADVVLCGQWPGDDQFEALRAGLTGIRLQTVDALGVPSAALKAATVALLGLLHLDQAPANVPSATGARTPRVLGRLTPGSVVNWHHLVRELAARRPNVVTLRNAV
jgi:1,6-anhydro-N-acetylmuramate kinase